MKNLKKTILVLSAGLLIFSTACDETTDSDGSGSLLAKITWVEDGGNEVATLEYDGQNRLVKIKESYTEEGTVYNYEMHVSYNAEGKVSQVLDVEDGVEDWKQTYTYTSNTITEQYWEKLEGNWVEDSYKTVYDLNSSGQITKGQNFYNDGEGWYASSYELYTWTNENISKIEDWGIGFAMKRGFTRFHQLLNKLPLESSLKSINDTKYSTETYMFDDKNNPFKVLGIINGTEGLNRNNVTKETYTYEGQSYEEVTNYVYEYNSDNYPTKITGTYIYGDGTETDVMLLEYK